MENMINISKIGIATIGGVLGRLIGNMDGLLYTLVIFVILDYVTGLMVAVKEKKLSSEVGFVGIAKKVLIFFLVIVANMLDLHVLGGDGIARMAVVFFYLANEGLSITENAAKFGVPLPEKLIDILEQLKTKE